MVIPTRYKEENDTENVLIDPDPNDVTCTKHRYSLCDGRLTTTICSITKF